MSEYQLQKYYFVPFNEFKFGKVELLHKLTRLLKAKLFKIILIGLLNIVPVKEAAAQIISNLRRGQAVVFLPPIYYYIQVSSYAVTLRHHHVEDRCFQRLTKCPYLQPLETTPSWYKLVANMINQNLFLLVNLVSYNVSFYWN